ncbi:Ran-interacting Mog1 protein [Sesbania bispinosa]|nr:Ran-interacting Mog1 protein [Sesbania bispinosa]
MSANVREVPDHQEVFSDPSRDQSLIFKLLEFKHDVVDNGSVAYGFFKTSLESRMLKEVWYAIISF